MTSIPDFVVMVVCLGSVLTSTWFGIARGQRVNPEDKPQSDHLGTIQSALLGLLGLLLGFAFAGAMARYVDRQDALAREANAIETAYQRMSLLPDARPVQALIREYASLRVELFRQQAEKDAPRLMAGLNQKYDAAMDAAVRAVKEEPRFAALIVPGIEAIDNEFSARNAIARRHLPSEFVLVMLACSCVSMGIIGYGVGIAKPRSVGSAYTLAGLVGVTLFITFDFDRPSKGLIRLDPAPLTEMLERLGGPVNP